MQEHGSTQDLAKAHRSSGDGHVHGEPVLQIMLQQWQIQYHTTLGMNARIAAVFAFSGIALGFLSDSEVIRQHDPLAICGGAAFLIAVVCLLVSAWTRWAKWPPPVVQMANATPVEAAQIIEEVVEFNDLLLRRKSNWLHRGLIFTLVGLLLVSIAVLGSTY